MEILQRDSRISRPDRDGEMIYPYTERSESEQVTKCKSLGIYRKAIRSQVRQQGRREGPVRSRSQVDRTILMTVKKSSISIVVK